MSCKLFLPKFLWKHIIEQLSMTDIKAMLVSDKSFDSLIDDDVWMQYLFKEIQSNIIIVRCKTEPMDKFWKYAYYNHMTCDKIETAIDLIESDNKSNATFNKKLVGNNIFSYKVLIKQGDYLISNRYKKFYHTKCNIEIIGGYEGVTTISPTGTDWDKDVKPFYVSGHLIIKNITFHYLYVIYKQKSIDDISSLVISDCRFETNCILDIGSICNTHITNCMFDDSSLNIYPENKSVINNYIIENSTFTNYGGDWYLELYSGSGKPLTVSIIGNTFDNNTPYPGALISNEAKYATIMVTNNNIINVHTCICTLEDIGSPVILENNIFTNVQSLFDETVGIAKLGSSNTFVNCGINLTKYVDQNN